MNTATAYRTDENRFDTRSGILGIMTSSVLLPILSAIIIQIHKRIGMMID